MQLSPELDIDFDEPVRDLPRNPGMVSPEYNPELSPVVAPAPPPPLPLPPMPPQTILPPQPPMPPQGSDYSHPMPPNAPPAAAPQRAAQSSLLEEGEIEDMEMDLDED